MPQRPSDPQPRKFEYAPAVRKAVPLIIGINSPSGGGKTFSALRLATGIQRIVGGDIAGVDSEANRMLHYADQFKFHHIPFGPPFSPADYLEVLRFAAKKGARTIVTDSTSHLHDGPGGVLEMHEEELQRLGGGDKNSFGAWAYPKSELRKFINAFTTGLTDLEHPINLIFCFRAKPKMHMERGAREIEKLGLMPIASEELIFEMTTNILLYAGSRGVPTWQTPLRGEQQIIKLPDQFQHMFGVRSQLDEEIGAKMAEWSSGGAAPKATVSPDDAKKNAGWITYWNKKGISTDRVLATIRKPSVDLIDVQDRERFDDFVKVIKDKQKTAEQLFSSNEAPTDDDEPTEDKGDAPSAAELAATAATNGNGASAGKVA
jgi:hypothetical protein